MPRWIGRGCGCVEDSRDGPPGETVYSAGRQRRLCWRAMNAPVLNSQANYEAQVAFVAELASRLHSYGTTAHRLEGAISGVARRLGLDCDVWSNPTGIILSFADPG